MVARLFRIRVLLRIHDFVSLHPFHAPVIYALLAEANRENADSKAAVPDGLMIDAPERCRIALRPGDDYAFGFSLLAGSMLEAHVRVRRLTRGLERIGKQGKRGTALGGNFSVQFVTDLISGQAIHDDSQLQPFPKERLDEEIARLTGCSRITLEFHSPLRMKRPKNERSPGHRFVDGRWCVAETMLKRLQLRQSRVGFPPDAEETVLPADCIRLHGNHLTWLDVSYGGGQQKKSLGGAFGRIELAVNDERVLRTLVSGQYIGGGENTRFGFGRYRIVELGPDPSACGRATPLTELCFRQPVIDRAAGDYQLDSGLLAERIRQIRRDDYQPDPVHYFTIARKAGGSRRLAIPTRADRGLQKCVHELLAPAVERFLEDSSLAYRKGLGRERAAKRIRTAWQDGFRWALKADFLAFFDSVDHQLLEHRLHAWIGDRSLVDLIMRWVREMSPLDGCGLPTGAVISPLLANIFLDQFDEDVEQSGWRLVRYADDFMLLFQTEDEAKVVFADAEAAANRLSLELNADKTRLVSLTEPFRFLGFEFQPETNWRPLPTGEPVHMNDLGWIDSAAAPKEPLSISLPGEQPLAATAGSSLCILGPGVRRLDVDDGRLAYAWTGSSQQSRLRSMDRIRELIVLGTPSLSPRFLKSVQRNNIPVTLASPNGAIRSVLLPSVARVRPSLLECQVQVSTDPVRQLAVARELVRAKLTNYAVLADAVPGRDSDLQTGVILRSLAESAVSAASLDQLRGIEGAGASQWYRSLDGRLPRDFRFEKRVAPRASDPVNALLNLCQSTLYRHCDLLLQQAGFASSLGIYHVSRAGHFALASDVQEVFRHVMDRVVLDACGQLHPSDFEKKSRGRFRLQIRPHAVRRVLGVLHRTLALPVREHNSAEPMDYRQQIARTIRSLRRSLMDDEPFVAFRHRFETDESGSSTPPSLIESPPNIPV